VISTRCITQLNVFIKDFKIARRSLSIDSELAFRRIRNRKANVALAALGSSERQGDAKITLCLFQVQGPTYCTADRRIHEDRASEPLDRGPYFDVSASRNVTALVGKTATLNCRVRNLGDRTVSETSSLVYFAIRVFKEEEQREEACMTLPCAQSCVSIELCCSIFFQISVSSDKNERSPNVVRRCPIIDDD